MTRTIAAYCGRCRKTTNFTFDGGGWECHNCGSYKVQGGYDDSEFPFNIFRDY